MYDGTTPLRPVGLPPGLGLYLSAMPGRAPIPLAAHIAAIRAAGIRRILCLTAPAEIARKAPAYAGAIAAGTLPCPVDAHPLADFGTPADADAFTAWVRVQAADLRAGMPMLLHCAAGIGRTGTVALCLLHTLGISQAEALVAAAGSQPETPQQRAFVARFRTEAPA